MQVSCDDSYFTVMIMMLIITAESTTAKVEESILAMWLAIELMGTLAEVGDSANDS